MVGEVVRWLEGWVVGGVVRGVGIWLDGWSEGLLVVWRGVWRSCLVVGGMV